MFVLLFRLLPKHRVLALFIGLLVLAAIIAACWFWIYPALGNLFTSVPEGVTVE